MAIGRLKPHIRVEGPAMPKSKIKYAIYDGFATRLTSDGEIWCCFDGKWRVPSRPMQVFCYEAGLLTEQAYLRMFGPTGRCPVPPLPDAAFCSGWRSPLV
jgi:hypothetical protein